jgi:GNAT superfamily N-acetyltransferase
MLTQPEIRPARVDDYADFTRLFAELAVPDPIPSADAWRDQLAPRTLVAERDGAVVGYCYFELLADSAYIRHVAVDPGRRRGGIGLALLDAVAARAREAGCSRWGLNVKPDNLPAIGLYRRIGMAPRHESTAMRIAWADVVRLPGLSAVAAIDETLDAAAEHRFGLPRGQLASARPRRVILVLCDGDAIVGLAAFDPSFPGAFPFRLAALDYARPLLDAMRPHARPTDERVGFVIEDGRALVEGMQQAGAMIVLEIVHFEGPLG